jgi:hypothetical protein
VPDAALPEVTLQRHGGLGYCIGKNQFAEAYLVSVPEGSSGGEMVVSGTVHREWDTTSSPACAYWGCEVVEPVAVGSLTPEQELELAELLAAVPGGECQTQPNPACDYCLVTEVWTSRYVDGLLIEGPHFVANPCAAEVCPGYHDAVYAIADFFDRLVPPVQVNCSADADCALAVNMGVCCPSCGEAYLAWLVKGHPCLVGPNEDAGQCPSATACNDVCPPVDCPTGVHAACENGACVAAP